MNVKTILSKPLPVVWYRFVQLLKWKFYYKTKFWHKLEAKVQRKVNNNKHFTGVSSLFSSEFSERDIPQTLKNETLATAKEIIKGNIPIYDLSYSLNTQLPWKEDWRVQHHWKDKYYKSFSFYETNKVKEYDVKFPWELSRLSFLITVARAYQLENDTSKLDYIEEILTDWKTKNPVGFSVNWYAMEASVRVINLIQLREILIRTNETEKVIGLLNEILLTHGVFLWRNVEYTDVRGNHYAANLTALMLLGSTFKDFYTEAKSWFAYALKKTEKEFHLQFIQDGVNLEKSISYHRLVVEFFLISFIVMQRSGKQLKSKTLQLLQNTLHFTYDCTKPNHLTPIIGDNDSASVFQNDTVTLNNHTNILQLGSLFLNDNTVNIIDKGYFSAYELFGVKATRKLAASPLATFEVKHYAKGGFAMVKHQRDYFITDIGEVGMKGRGGHGHNDLFSFELMYEGEDIIVDPGSYTYTGCLEQKAIMRATSYHNGLVVDGEEMAPLIGNWGISNVAEPKDVRVTEEETLVHISGKHYGYHRLEDPVTHERIFNLEKDSFKLTCEDVIHCKSAHKITRNIHFSEKIALKNQDKTIYIQKDNATIAKLTVDPATSIRIEDYTLSYNYGSKTTALKVILETQVYGNTSITYAFEKA